MASLKDIAKVTGLSISTVSRALNPSPGSNDRIAEKTAARVAGVARRIGYVPNRGAEFLRRGGTPPTIGVFVPGQSKRFDAEVVQGIAEEAERLSFPLSLSFGMSLDKYRKFMRTTERKRHSGIITYPYWALGASVDAALRRYARSGGKVVMINHEPKVPDIPSVWLDDVEGGRIAARRLVARGCRTYCFLTEHGVRPGVFGRDGLPRYSRNRYDGFCETLSAAGFEVAGSFDLPGTVAQLRERRGGSPVGVFCPTDYDALSLYALLFGTGLVIGCDVLVIGYDNMHMTECFSPPLTTIHQRMIEVGGLALKKLVNLIYNRPETSEAVGPVLIERESA